MKNMHFLFCLFLSSFALHSMENDEQQIIKNNFKKYVANRLVEYKKHVFSYDDIQNIDDTYNQMMNEKDLSFLGDCLHRDVCDEEGNTFIHFAAKHKDLKVVEWALRCMHHPLSIPNKYGKEPIDICIDQLMPQGQQNTRDEEYRVFNALIVGYDKIGFDYDHRRNFLKKIVALEFEYIKEGIDIGWKYDLLKYFSGNKPISLPEIYQEISDENGNTFGNYLVSHRLSDALYTFIIKNYITFRPNQQNENPLALAQKNWLEVANKLFRECAPNKDFNITEASQEIIKEKCCYFMLLNLQKKRDNVDFKQCCNQHFIEIN
jgi:hypothetical protein